MIRCHGSPSLAASRLASDLQLSQLQYLPSPSMRSCTYACRSHVELKPQFVDRIGLARRCGRSHTAPCKHGLSAHARCVSSVAISVVSISLQSRHLPRHIVIYLRLSSIMHCSRAVAIGPHRSYDRHVCGPATDSLQLTTSSMHTSRLVRNANFRTLD